MTEKNWHQNPWMWCGCGCCLGVVVIPILLASLGIGGAFWAIRNTGVQEEALAIAQDNPAVVSRLGQPLEAGWLISGNISYENDRGQADYSIPIVGPDGEGKLYVVAFRDDGEWEFQDLYVRIDGERFDLISGELPINQRPGAISGENSQDEAEAAAGDGGS